MTPKNTSDPLDENSLGVLDDAASVDTAVIGILSGTAQVNVVLPQDEDDDLDDDGVLDGEVVADLIVDEVSIESVKMPDAVASTTAISPLEAEAVAPVSASAASAAKPEPHPLVSETATTGLLKSASKASTTKKSKKKPATATNPAPAEPATEAVVPEAKAPEENRTDAKVPKRQAPEATVPEVEAPAVKVPEINTPEVTGSEVQTPAAPEPEAPSPALTPAAAAAKPAPRPSTTPAPADDIVIDAVIEETPGSRSPIIAPAETITDAVVVDDETSAAEEAAIAARFLARANADASAEKATLAPAASAPIEKETAPVTTPEEKAVVTQPTRAAARAEVTLTSKRLDDLSESGRETADLLTADRLLDPHRVAKPEPEGAWSHFLYTVSGRRINIGDGKRAKDRKALTARIAAPLVGGARFVPVLSRKGGVGKTTITALLGMALADAREDRVIAVDANPDRGTLADRVVRPHHSKSVRDLVRIHDEVKGYHDISAIVARDATRLDVLASDADPRIAEAFSDDDYRDVAGVAAHYYSLVLTDTGTGIVHSVMAATLDLADQIVIVSGLSVDEARLASETLTWLETNGYAEQARDAIVVLNQSTPGAPLVRLNELESHFATRAKRVVRMPYDTQIAGGGTIVFANLQPETRAAARELAALLVEGLRGKAA
ncbi:MinD/ParA family ATP-binding protein [Microbacterium sp. LWO12-1.2]|uniref:MinD/ParA family ATP-binding protein n=1 Tax=Microbacterium sp. LWO12-1.2 TaxID=3135261 RepID=UPI00341A1C42